jgi:hypothetical protein
MSPAKKPRNYRATDATMINTAATRKREAELAAQVRWLKMELGALRVELEWFRRQRIKVLHPDDKHLFVVDLGPKRKAAKKR